MKLSGLVATAFLFLALCQPAVGGRPRQTARTNGFTAGTRKNRTPITRTPRTGTVTVITARASTASLRFGRITFAGLFIHRPVARQCDFRKLPISRATVARNIGISSGIRLRFQRKSSIRSSKISEV